MPVYEYSCSKCGLTVELLRKISERDDPVTEEEAGSGATVGPCDSDGCEFVHVLSPTPTTFRFADFTGYAGLDKTRSMHGPVKRKPQP